MVHENAPHDASGNGQEMRAVLPRNIFGIDQPQVGFIDERRRLKAVPGTLSCHAPSRDLVKLPLYERNQSVEGGRVALTPFQKQCGGLRGMVRNVAILSPFAWFTVSRPVSLYRREVCYASLPWIRIWDCVGWCNRPRVESGEFSVTADGGATISGRIVSASEMAGTISVPSCTTTPLLWRVSRESD